MLTETTRPDWQTRHLERQAREREARMIARDYHLAQLAAAPPTKQCAKCCQRLPLEDFRLIKNGVKAGQRKSRCKPCLAEDDRAAYHRKARLRAPKGTLGPTIECSNLPTEKRCYGCQQLLSLESSTLNRSGPKAGTRKARCKACRSAERKAAYVPRTALKELRERRATKRAGELSKLLSGNDPLRHIESQEEWDRAAGELRRLWLRSGDKQCVTCRATVPPTAMLPPGPGNFYTGNCQSCAGDLYRQSVARAGCKRPEGSPLLTLRDGSRITVAVLAQCYGERLRSRRALYRKVG